VSSEVKKGEGAKEVKKGEGAKGGGQRRKKSEAAQPLVKSVAVDEAASETGRGELLKLDSDFVIITTMADEISALEDFKAPPSPKADTPHKVAPPVQDEASQLEPQPVLSPPSIEAEGRETPQDSANEIYVSLLEDEGDFRAGQLATVKIHVGRGAYGQKPVTDASVIVKVLGTSFRPIIMTATTDDHGVAIVRALLPRFTSGRAAIIIRAVSGEDWAEMRRIIHQD
jgi:hypothetical protein